LAPLAQPGLALLSAGHVVLRVRRHQAPQNPIWFALDDSRPLFFFAGIWTPWFGTRGTKAAPDRGRTQAFGFLTTEPNSVVAPIHPKAMPVMLTEPEEIEVWMTAPWAETKALQRRLTDLLSTVAKGPRQDAIK
jgi:putative SOS response-associated peptidase YedK